MSLKYPLKYYDEAGRMKPPLVMYIMLLFVSRGLLILIISLSFREDSERLLRLFYPHSIHFYWSLIPIIPALLGLYVVSKRSLLWEKKQYVLFRALPWFMITALLLDLAIQLYMLWQIHFRYSLSHGLSIIISATFIIYIMQSEYFKTLLQDWNKP